MSKDLSHEEMMELGEAYLRVQLELKKTQLEIERQHIDLFHKLAEEIRALEIVLNSCDKREARG